MKTPKLALYDEFPIIDEHGLRHRKLSLSMVVICCMLQRKTRTFAVLTVTFTCGRPDGGNYEHRIIQNKLQLRSCESSSEYSSEVENEGLYPCS